MSSAKNALQRVTFSGLKQHARTFITSRTPQRDASLGFGRPLNAASAMFTWSFGKPPRRLRFPNALEDWLAEPLTLRERAMMAMMGNVMSKVEWQRKVFDVKICAKWRVEALGEDFSEKMFDYCIDELRDNAHFFRQHGFVPILDATATVCAGDVSVGDDIRQALRRGAAELEDRPDGEKDLHPGSDGKVLDLVHPSLYPLVYGRTRAVVNMAGAADGSRTHWPRKGEIIPVPDESDRKVAKFYDIGQGMNAQLYSQKFQWLPCDVHFESENKVRIASYINNLHPEEHKHLYRTIEKVIDKTVPMWNRTLSALDRRESEPRIKMTEIELADSAKRPRQPVDNENELDEDERLDLDMEWQDEIYDIVPPQPGEYSDYSRRRQTSDANGHKVDLRHDFATEGLQIIVKLANIHLSSEKPEYVGGSWHIEGQLNEHICASALYYYDSHNITDSYLAFRETMDTSKLEELPYEQSQFRWIEDYYGIQNNVDSIQELGRVLTKEGRLLTFPNVLQHRVEPFRLADTSKSGHRKVLALFLVDPHLRIPSTSIVPPQQKEWWDKGMSPSAMNGLTPETTQSFLVDNSDALMDLSEAKRLRLDLMAEKSALVDEVETPRLYASCNFCEH